MPPIITNAEAAQYSAKVDNFGKVLKSASRGGPQVRAWDEAGFGATAEYKNQHPRFPDFYYPDDRERDTYFAAKRQLASDPKFIGKVQATDADIQYMMDKKNVREMVLFKQFVENSIPRGTPWAADYFERFMPGWYKSKSDIIKEKLNIIGYYAMLVVRGPQTIQELDLLYQLYTGKIAIPSNWQELITGSPGQVVKADQFASGLYNPKRWITDDIRISKRNQDFMANFAIPGFDLKGATDAANLANRYAFNEADFITRGADEKDYAGSIKRPTWDGRAVLGGGGDVTNPGDWNNNYEGRWGHSMFAAPPAPSNANNSVEPQGRSFADHARGLF